MSSAINHRGEQFIGELCAAASLPAGHSLDGLVGSAELSLVQELARSLHRYGVPAHLLEDALSRVAARLGVHGEFFVTPTAILGAFRVGEGQQTFMTRLEPGEVDLDKLVRVEAVIADLHEGLGTEVARQRIAAIAEDRPRFGPLITTLSLGVASAGAACFLGGGLPEVAAAAVIGTAIGVECMFVQPNMRLMRLFEPMGAATAALIATLLASVMPLAAPLAILAGIIVLLPGLTLTVAMSELASRHLVSGTARLMNALVIFLGIGFGVALGTQVGRTIVGPLEVVAPTPLPDWTLAIALLLAPMAIAVLFRAQARDLPFVVVAGAIAYLGARFGAILFGPELGTFVGALLVGGVSNVTARLRHRPTSVTLVPALMLLVPGSIGFHSLSSFLAGDVLPAIDTAFTMTLVGMALVMGLLVANLCLPARHAI